MVWRNWRPEQRDICENRKEGRNQRKTKVEFSNSYQEILVNDEIRFKGVGKCQECLLGFQWNVARNREARSQVLFGGGARIDNDFGLEHFKFLVPEYIQGEMSSRHLQIIIY